MPRLLSFAPRLVFILSLFALTLGYWRRGALPDAASVQSELLATPQQGETDRAPFTVSYEGVNYEVEPVAT